MTTPIASPSAATTPNRPGPLDGLRVIDLSTVFAVPYLGALLGDYGADVIKIESPDRLEQTRGVVFGPLLDNEAVDEPWNNSGSFGVLNRNKRSIVVDMKSLEGQELLWRLVREADVLLDNFTPRVLKSWGFTHEAIVEANPSIIHLSNTGFGSTGPWSSYKAQGTTLEVTMGVGAYSGYQNSAPTKIGQSYPDFLAAWTGLTALMAALVHRHHTGEGQWIDLGMYQLGAAVIPEAIIDAQSGGSLGVRGNRELGAAVSGVFESNETERWVAVSVAPDAVPAVAGGVDGLDGSDPESALSSWVAARPAAEAAEALRALGAGAAVMSDARDLLLDEQLRHREFFEPLQTPDDADQRPVIGQPYRWVADTAVVSRRRAPRFGEHNAEVLAETGLDVDEAARLVEAGVVTATPRIDPGIVPIDVDLTLERGVYRYVDPDYRSVLRDTIRPGVENEADSASRA